MTLIPWKRKQPESLQGEFSPLAALRADMDRLFDTYVREPFGAMDWPFGSAAEWSPTVDVAETDREVTVRAELPGIAPEDLDVTITGTQLILSGEKKEATKKKDKDYYHAESRWGCFRRSIPLPDSVDPEKVQAEYASGVLTIRVEKSTAARPKQIEVKVKD